MPDSSESWAFAWRPADPEALRLAFETSLATKTPAPANWSNYVDNVSRRLLSWFEGVGSPILGALGPGFAQALKWFVVVLAAVLVIVLAARIFRRLRPQTPGVAVKPARRNTAAQDLGVDDYKAAALRAIEGGGAREALSAIWWWFGAAVLKRRPEPDMTTNDVIVRSNRPDLRRIGQALDRLRFSAAEPAAADVRALLFKVEAAL